MCSGNLLVYSIIILQYHPNRMGKGAGPGHHLEHLLMPLSAAVGYALVSAATVDVIATLSLSTVYVVHAIHSGAVGHVPVHSDASNGSYAVCSAVGLVEATIKRKPLRLRCASKQTVPLPMS